MTRRRKIRTEDCWCSPAKNLERTVIEKGKGSISHRKQLTNLKFDKKKYNINLLLNNKSTYANNYSTNRTMPRKHNWENH